MRHTELWYAAVSTRYFLTLQSLSMLASVVSFAEGRRQFPVFVPKHSAAGLDAPHVVRLAQLRGSRDRGTNNRLRDLPRQDSTGLVGVGSGTIAAQSTSRMAPLSDALAAFAKVMHGLCVCIGCIMLRAPD